MISLITGAINAGKTQKIEAIYRQLKQGDGFISKKIFHSQEKDICGYLLYQLSTGQQQPLALKSQYLPPGWQTIYSFGPYRFSRLALEFAETLIDMLLARNIGPSFIDEIGPLELQGQGFFSILQRVLKYDIDVYITVRKVCLTDVVQCFSIHRYRLIEVGD